MSEKNGRESARKGEKGKKLLILAVYEILRRWTDERHPLRYAGIIEKLEEEYGLTATRKSVQAHVNLLQQEGYPVYFQKGWYYQLEFTSAELNLLMDSLMSSSFVSPEQRQALWRKLSDLGGKWFQPEGPVPEGPNVNQAFLRTIDLLHEAIAQEKQVSFHYGNYDVDKKLHPRLDERGLAKLYRINPYRVLCTNGRFYLVCNVDKYDTLCHFRVDRILDIRLLKHAVKPLGKVQGIDGELDLTEYIHTHPYMHAGKARTFRLLVRRDKINDVLDWFGMDVTFTRATETEAEVEVVSDAESLRFWLRRYGDFATELKR